MCLLAPRTFYNGPTGPAVELNEPSGGINLHRFSLSVQDINAIPPFGSRRVWRWRQRGSASTHLCPSQPTGIWRKCSVFTEGKWGGEEPWVFSILSSSNATPVCLGERETHYWSESRVGSQKSPPALLQKTQTCHISCCCQTITQSLLWSRCQELRYRLKKKRQSTRADGLQMKSRSIHATRKRSTRWDAMKQSKEV